VPFEGRDTTKRIDELRKQCQSIRKFYETGDIKGHKQRTREAYVELRMSRERAQEEVLFGKVVIRFRKRIMTDRLKNVLVDDSDYPEVEVGMTKCSNYAHDKAMEGGAAMPHPDELLADINALDKWRVKVVSRSRARSKDAKRCHQLRNRALASCGFLPVASSNTDMFVFGSLPGRCSILPQSYDSKVVRRVAD
jgi:hypothetical protein